MFKYFYRISDLHNSYNITAISVYTEDKEDFKPNKFEHNLFGTELTYKFNTYKVLEQEEEALKESNNIFAFVVLAVLYSLRAKDNQKTKLNFKVALTKILISKKYSEEDILELFEFINLFLSFKNEKYDNLFYEELDKMPKTKEKESLSSYDKFILKKGKKEIVINMLKKGSPVEFISEVTGLSIKQVEKLQKDLK